MYDLSERYEDVKDLVARALQRQHQLALLLSLQQKKEGTNTHPDVKSPKPYPLRNSINIDDHPDRIRNTRDSNIRPRELFQAFTSLRNRHMRYRSDPAKS